MVFTPNCVLAQKLDLIRILIQSEGFILVMDLSYRPQKIKNNIRFNIIDLIVCHIYNKNCGEPV